MSELTKLDAAGLAFIAKEEGCILHPYLDSVGIPTIGIGMTYYPDTGKRVTMSDPPITKEKAIEYFGMMVKNYELAVYSACRDDINQNQFNALVSLCYNIGVNAFKRSTVVRKVNQNPADTTITEAFCMWRKPPELLPRRQREASLYFST